MSDELRWGILGTGRIAAALAQAINTSQGSELVAVGSRQQQSADAFADQWDIPHRHAGYEGVLEDDAVDIVYVSLPNHLHAPWSIRAAAAGKHILCEKPLAMDADEARNIVDAAGRHDVFLMEAFMYRCHPQTSKLVELLREDSISRALAEHPNPDQIPLTNIVTLRALSEESRQEIFGFLPGH